MKINNFRLDNSSRLHMPELNCASCGSLASYLCVNKYEYQQSFDIIYFYVYSYAPYIGIFNYLASTTEYSKIHSLYSLMTTIYAYTVTEQMNV